jgi:hypothetical protein
VGVQTVSLAYQLVQIWSGYLGFGIVAGNISVTQIVGKDKKNIWFLGRLILKRIKYLAPAS